MLNSRQTDFASHVDLGLSPSQHQPPPHPRWPFIQLQLGTPETRSSGGTHSVFYCCDDCEELTYMEMNTFSYFLLILALPSEVREKQSSPTLMRKPFSSFSTTLSSYDLLSRHNITSFQTSFVTWMKTFPYPSHPHVKVRF